MNIPSRDMHHDLSTAALDLSGVAIDMLSMAVRLSVAGMEDEAMRLISMAEILGAVEDATKSYADQVSSGIVVRASINWLGASGVCDDAGDGRIAREMLSR